MTPAGAQREGPTVIVDPLRRPDWDALAATHAASTIFHRSGWARVLHETYGHSPMYVCRFDGARLAETLPLMEVNSRWTGRRGVSLPFTDACAALRGQDADGRGLYREAMDCGSKRRWKYLECRNCDAAWDGAAPSLEFLGHAVDLRIGVDLLFKGLDGATRRGVRKAESGGLKVGFGAGTDSVRTFYKLHCATRRRHGLPPQPYRFFENIQRHILGLGGGFVALARLGDRPAAAGFFFVTGGRRFTNLGPRTLGCSSGVRTT
jgi:hypothetical protein